MIADALATHPDHAGIRELHRALRDESAEPGARLRAACALAVIEPGFSLGPDASATASLLAEALLTEPGETRSLWFAMLGPAARSLVQPIVKICCDPPRDPTVQVLAIALLTEAQKAGYQDVVLGFLKEELNVRVNDMQVESEKEMVAARQAVAGITLAVLGEPNSLWPLLWPRDDPRLRSLLIPRLAAGRLPAHVLLDRLTRANVYPIERQAHLLAWAEAHRVGISATVDAAVVEAARTLYLEDPHPGVHSAAELLLMRWRGPQYLAKCNQDAPKPGIGSDGLGWEHGPQGHTFAILPAPLTFRMGSPEHEQGRIKKEETPHHRRIDRSLEVSTKEVSADQFREFDKDYWQESPYGDVSGCVATSVSWHQAVQYCNWLSEKAGIPRSQWCYPETTQSSLAISENAVKRDGFRLPTEAEWEYFCRAGTETAWSCGESRALLPYYAWTWVNSGNCARPPALLLPNGFGIFDAMGNVWEWCQDGPPGAYPDVPKPPYPEGTAEHPANDPGRAERAALDAKGTVTWRMLRGGSFSSAPEKSRSAHRDWGSALDRLPNFGFRIVRTLPPDYNPANRVRSESR